jgi:hypothetical protein
MPQPVDVNGKTIQYPIVGESEWGVEATDFAVQVAGALAKIGQSTPPATNNITIPSGNLTVTTGNTDLGGTLDVTGATNLDSTLDVTGVTTIVDDLIVDTDTLFVDVSTDRVGINTATPTVALDVVGDIKSSAGITGASATLTDLTVDTNLIKTDSANDRVGINTTSPTVALDVTGDVKQSGILLNSDGTVSTPSISFTNDTNTGLYRIGSDIIGIAVNGSKIAQLDSNGIMASYPYWIIVDQKTAGTSGGTFTSGDWRTRDLNTTIGSNTITGSSLSSDQFTLPSGTYKIFVSAPSYYTGNHKAKLRNITDSSDTILGSNERSANSGVIDGSQTFSVINGIFTIASSKTFEIQHRCQTSQSTNGFGNAMSFSVSEIYTQVEIRKLA